MRHRLCRATDMPALSIVYILRSRRDPARHYVGLTSNVAARLQAHNAGESHHTAKHTPWDLLVTLEFAKPETAARFEKCWKPYSPPINSCAVMSWTNMVFFASI